LEFDFVWCVVRVGSSDGNKGLKVFYHFVEAALRHGDGWGRCAIGIDGGRGVCSLTTNFFEVCFCIAHYCIGCTGGIEAVDDAGGEVGYLSEFFFSLVDDVTNGGFDGEHVVHFGLGCCEQSVQSEDLQGCSGGVVEQCVGDACIDKVLKVCHVFYVALFGC